VKNATPVGLQNHIHDNKRRHSSAGRAADL
jgi:hypothetical protein